MAPVGVGPGVAKPTPGDELSVGEALTKKRQDLAEFMGCSIEVVDDLEALTAGEKGEGEDLGHPTQSSAGL